MSTFSSSEAKIEIRKRFDRLTPQTPRLWGRMSPQQMLCHLTDGYRVSSGDIRPKPADNFFTRSVLRLFALHTSMAWPKGAFSGDEDGGGDAVRHQQRDQVGIEAAAARVQRECNVLARRGIGGRQAVVRFDQCLGAGGESDEKQQTGNEFFHA